VSESKERRKIDGSKWAGSRKGVACKCGSRASHVYRVVNGESRITRERQCVHCGHRWSTIEVDRDSLAASGGD